MLYVTTRNDRDVFTAQRVLRENRGPDGGMYRPFHMPKFSPDERNALLEKPFNQCVAEVLNILFHSQLTGWDVDFAVGRYPVRLKQISHRIIVAETWHNPEWHFDRMVRNLASKLSQDDSPGPGEWVQIAVRIATLFAICGELRRNGIDTVIDVSVVSGDFTGPISAWYARQWGLPIGSIVCCCNENSNLWDLFCYGQLRTDAVSVQTSTPKADIVLPSGLERMICECGGISEVFSYLEACRQGRSYIPEDSIASKLRSGMYVSVVSQPRLMNIIPSVYRTHGYLLSPYDALAYGGLQDYRTAASEYRYALILSEESPRWEVDTVAEAMGTSAEEIKKML